MILTEPTPNPQAIKFYALRPLVGSGSIWYDIDLAINGGDFIKKIFRTAGVRFALLQENFITITKFPQWDWEEIKPKIKKILETELFYIESGDTDAYCTDEICCAVREIIEKEIRPSVQLDGGDIRFIRYKDGIVEIKMQGSCWGCPNHESTLGAVFNKVHVKVPEVKQVRLQ